MAGPSAGYSAAVTQHFETPRNAGRFAPGTRGVITGQAGEQRLGRSVRFELRIGDQAQVLESRYQVYGCPATIALCSIVSERLKDRPLSEAADWDAVAIVEELGLPAAKRAAALMVQDALRAALAGYNMHRKPEHA